jgi:hypothetical protein
MYIRTLALQNIKLLRDLRIDFRKSSGEPRMWTVFVGENGLCKTTILQTVALAASGPDRANQLSDIVSLPDRRNEKEPARITAEFDFGPLHQHEREYPKLPPDRAKETAALGSYLTIRPGWNVFLGGSAFFDRGEPLGKWRDENLSHGEDPLQVARGRNLPHWFVAGYGVERSLPQLQLAALLTDNVLQRLNSLFGNGDLIGTGFADLLGSADLVHQFSARLQEALIPRLLPKISNLELRGRGGIRSAADMVESYRFDFHVANRDVRVPATWLSQGYQGLIAWVADLIGQQFRDTQATPELEKMEGLVLIDELDLYLHPTWQVLLVPRLKKVFPRLQFIVTTHSPMLLPGFEREEIFMLRQDAEGNVIAQPAEYSPMLMTGSEIYRVFFGVEGLYPTEAGDKLQRYGFLSSNPRRSDMDEQEMTRLRSDLAALGVEPNWKPVPREAR